MPNEDGFLKVINDSEAGQFLSLTASLIGVGQFLQGLLTQSDTDLILAALDNLEQTLSKDFSLLGNLIKQQIRLVIENEDALALATALAHTNTARDKLARFLRTQDAADIEAADTESDLGVQFFLALPALALGPTMVAKRTDPFFLPGVAAAGTIRISVISQHDRAFRTISSDRNQINMIISLFQGMIDLAKVTVDNAHTVELKSHLSHAHPVRTETRQEIFDGYMHQEDGVTVQFFSAHEARDFDDIRVTRARASAEAARREGVLAEQAFIGIPGFETLLQQWRNTLNR